MAVTLAAQGTQWLLQAAGFSWASGGIANAVIGGIAYLESEYYRKKIEKKLKGAQANRDNPLSTITSTEAPRRIIYGRTRIGGIRAFAEVSDHPTTTDKSWLNQVFILGDDGINSIEKLFLNGKEVRLEIPHGVIGPGNFNLPRGAFGGRNLANVTKVG